MHKTRGAQRWWEAKEEGSQPGAAPLVWVRLGDLSFASLGGRMDPLAVSMSCPVATKDPLSPLPGLRLYGNTTGHRHLWHFSHPGNKVAAPRGDF